MEFTIFRSNVMGVVKNVIYKQKEVITSCDDLARVAQYDHVAAAYKNNHRKIENFIESNCILMDCDNDDTENSTSWLKPEDIRDYRLPNVEFYYVPSRNCDKVKHHGEPEEKSARPRYHYYFPLKNPITDAAILAEYVNKLHIINPEVDHNAKDAARFFYGYREPVPVAYHVEGSLDLIEYIDSLPASYFNITGIATQSKSVDASGITLDTSAIQSTGNIIGDRIPNGSRNATLFKIATQLLTRYGGDCAEVRAQFIKYSKLCETPLDDKELNTIYKSAVLNFNKHIGDRADYISPEDYNTKMNGLEQAAADALRDGLDISILTADDFKTKDPFEYVCRIMAADPFTGNVVLMELKQKAKDLGITGAQFDTLLKSFQSNQKATENTAPAFTEDGFSDVAEHFGFTAKYPVKYHCADDYGITVDSGFMGMFQQPVCLHPILPTKISKDCESGLFSYDISFKRKNVRHGAWETVEGIPAADAYTATKLVEVMAGKGAAVSSENAKALTEYLVNMVEANRSNIAYQYTTTHLGWLPDGSFAPYSPDIVLQKSATGNNMHEYVTQEGNLDTWITAMKTIRDGNHIEAEIMLTASFASVLVNHTCRLPFFVHLWSTLSGAGKTVALMCAGSVWGDVHEGRLLRSMHSTKVGMEMMANTMRNLPLLLDELQTINKGADLQEIIYSLAEGVGKARGAKSGGLQNQTNWSNIILSTGEQPIADDYSKAGALNRVISINTNKSLFANVDEAAALVDVVINNFGIAGKEFITQLQQDGQIEKAKEIYHEFCNDEAFKIAHITGKQINSAACLLTASVLMNMYVFNDDHVLTVNDLIKYLQTNESIEAGRRAFSWLTGYIAANNRNFIRQQADASDPRKLMTISPLGACWGEITEDEKVCYFITSALKKEMSMAGHDFEGFINWAILHGYAEKPEKKDDYHKDHLRRLPGTGTRARCIKFRMDRFAEDEEQGNDTEAITPDEQISIDVPW